MKIQDTEDVKQFLADSVVNSIAFFDRFAYDKARRTYFSEIDNDGKLVSGKICTVALSRLSYALAFASQWFPEYALKAKAATRFQLENMLATDSRGKYFIPWVEGDAKDMSPVLDFWQQSYGFCGLIELYRNSGDETMLNGIHELFGAYVERFHDQNNGGLFDNYSIETGQDEGRKSFQSTIYPVSSFLANLWETDVPNRFRYEPLLGELLDIASQKLWNEGAGWVNVTFDQRWNCTDSKLETPKVLPGHNFQLAWVLMRSREWEFIDARDSASYFNLGQHIVDVTLQKKIWDGSVVNGFSETVSPLDGAVLSRQKSWWQHSEAIIALAFAGQKYQQELEQLLSFYLNTFVDKKRGCEFALLDEKNQPVAGELKGSLGKSSYHHTEMIRFVLHNLQQFK